ncbi:MAG TPA: histidine kinase, partial [Thermoleophilaceae bacterium]
SNAPARPNLEAVMADALGDPSLRLAFPLAQGGFVDGAGVPIAVPGEPPAAVTEVRDEQGLMAAILHDPVLDEPAPGVVDAAGTAIMLALENARLEADVRASERALRESRARMLTAGVSERRRLERDLHDTAQQRLVALRIKLALGQERAGGVHGGGLATLLGELGADVEATIDSVRVVGRGLYPPLLADQGLGAALTSAMSRVPAHISVSVDTLHRSDPDVEAAVYLCCRSVVSLLAEHATDGARLTLTLERGELRIVLACERSTEPGLPARVLTQTRDHVGTLGGWVDYAFDANAAGAWRINAAVPWPARTSVDAPG